LAIKLEGGNNVYQETPKSLRIKPWVWKSGLFIVCLVIAVNLGFKVANIMSKPYQTIDNYNEIVKDYRAKNEQLEEKNKSLTETIKSLEQEKSVLKQENDTLKREARIKDQIIDKLTTKLAEKNDNVTKEEDR
jgi:cell division protein FtsB